MSIVKAVIVQIGVIGDGTSTSVSVDLQHDVYGFAGRLGGFGGSDSPVSVNNPTQTPKGAESLNNNVTATLSSDGHTLTLEFASPPGPTFQTVDIALTY